MFYITEETVSRIDGNGRLVPVGKVYFLRREPGGEVVGVYNDEATATSEMDRLEKEEQEEQTGAGGTRPRG